MCNSSTKTDPIEHRDIVKLEGKLKIQSGLKFWYNFKPKTRRWWRWISLSIITSAILLVIGWISEGRVWHYAEGNCFSDEAAGSFGLGLISIFIAIYWNLDAIFGRQWIYLAETFNQANAEPCPVRSGYMKTMLAMDCFDLKLWNHDTYEFFVEWHVKLAVLHYAKDKDLSALAVWTHGELTVDVANELLEHRRKELYFLLYESTERKLLGTGVRLGLYKRGTKCRKQ